MRLLQLRIIRNHSVYRLALFAAAERREREGFRVPVLLDADFGVVHRSAHNLRRHQARLSVPQGQKLRLRPGAGHLQEESQPRSGRRPHGSEKVKRTLGRNLFLSTLTKLILMKKSFP